MFCFESKLFRSSIVKSEISDLKSEISDFEIRDLGFDRMKSEISDSSDSESEISDCQIRDLKRLVFSGKNSKTQ